MGVEDESLQGGVRVARRRWNLFRHRVEQFPHTLARFGRDTQHFGGGNPDDLLDFPGHLVRIGGRQIHLVESSHDLQVVFECQGAVGEGLGFDALGGIDQQDHTFACRQRAGHLVSEVHMAGGVDQVDPPGTVREADALQLDRDAAFPLQVHGVEVLGAHVPGFHRSTQFQQPVGQGRLAVVDVGDDGDVAYAGLIHDLEPR